MGNGETTSPLCISDEASPNMEERSSKKDGTGSIKLHRTESCPSNDAMGPHHHRPFLSSPNGTDDDGGPYHYQNDSGGNEVERSTTTPPTATTTTSSSPSIFFPDHVVVTSGSGAGGLLAAASVRTLQPLDSCSLDNTASKSPGGGGAVGNLGMAAAAAALGFPFTAAQWKELERQAMIYKYMMASVPVPSDLLLPADPTAAPSVGINSSGGGSIYNLRYGNRDLEPGRCKRTDGKKWRCSRDVAPHQKYCERHMHRGRPRSRKPVELHSSSSSSLDNANNSNNNNKKSRLHQIPLHPNPPTAQPNNYSSPPFLGTTTIQQSKDPLLLGATIGQNIFASSHYKEPNRVFGWAMDDEVVAANGVEQQWLRLMDTKRGGGLAPAQDSIYDTNASTLQQCYGEEEPLNFFSYANTSDFASPGSIHSRNDQYHFFVNSHLIPPKQPQIDQHSTSRAFIDAWSSGDHLKTIDKPSAPSSKADNLPPSSLTLSMAMMAGNAVDESMGLAADSHHHNPKDCPVSWLPFTSGGPLAEVLQTNSVACGGSNPASPYASNGDSISPPATTVSSPTGILYRALFSQSDSSVCNSPTLVASAAPPEAVAFQLLS